MEPEALAQLPEPVLAGVKKPQLWRPYEQIRRSIRQAHALGEPLSPAPSLVSSALADESK